MKKVLVFIVLFSIYFGLSFVFNDFTFTVKMLVASIFFAIVMAIISKITDPIMHRFFDKMKKERKV